MANGREQKKWNQTSEICRESACGDVTFLAGPTHTKSNGGQASELLENNVLLLPDNSVLYGDNRTKIGVFKV